MTDAPQPSWQQSHGVRTQKFRKDDLCFWLGEDCCHSCWLPSRWPRPEKAYVEALLARPQDKTPLDRTSVTSIKIIVTLVINLHEVKWRPSDL